jgi:hypothetical protein
MALSDIISLDLARRLDALGVEDFSAIVKAASVGFGPAKLKQGVSAIARGESPDLPAGLGQAKPLNIIAWSFCTDHGQYADTYGLSVARAAELKDQLRKDPEPALAEIRSVVSARLAARGSQRPVVVLRDGIPGVHAGDHPPTRPRQGGVDLKKEIVQNGALYGMYKFVAEDTGRAGNLRFRVPLGSGLFAVFPNKAGAIDVARLCRVNGRSHPSIVDHVAFWRDNKAPVFGDDIPERVTFDGRLKPGEQPPPDPISLAVSKGPADKTGGTPPRQSPV